MKYRLKQDYQQVYSYFNTIISTIAEQKGAFHSDLLPVEENSSQLQEINDDLIKARCKVLLKCFPFILMRNQLLINLCVAMHIRNIQNHSTVPVY
jgi:hypothetical protein